MDTSVASRTTPPPSTGIIVEFYSDGGYAANYTTYANFDGTKFAKTNYYELDDNNTSPSGGDQFTYSPSDGSLQLLKQFNQSQSQLEGSYLWYDPSHGSLNYGGKGSKYKSVSLVVGADAHDAAAGKLVKVSCSLSQANDLSCDWGSSDKKVRADAWLCKGFLALVKPGYDATSDCSDGGITLNLTSLIFQAPRN